MYIDKVLGWRSLQGGSGLIIKGRAAGGEIEMKRMLGVLTMFELMWLAADWSKLVYMELTVNGHLAVTVYQSRLEDQYGWRSHLLDCQDHSLCLR